jgi:crotonobetainyl-CoA:carnitine CoA-transferase CaiB-like acyl-CoA transferase
MDQDRTRSPLLGEHAEEVLEQPGCSAEQIAALRTERVF